MPKFSEISENRLLTCHPALVKLMDHVVREFDISVLPDGGWRSPERQLELYEARRSKLMKSKHNWTYNGQPWSLAVDVAPYPVDFGQTPKQILTNYVDTRMTAETIAALEKQFIRATKVQARFYYMAGLIREKAATLNIKIRWGGDWDQDTDFFDQTFNDLVHFELVGYEDLPHEVGEVSVG